MFSVIYRNDSCSCQLRGNFLYLLPTKKSGCFPLPQRFMDLRWQKITTPPYNLPLLCERDSPRAERGLHHVGHLEETFSVLQCAQLGRLQFTTFHFQLLPAAIETLESVWIQHYKKKNICVTKKRQNNKEPSQTQLGKPVPGLPWVFLRVKASNNLVIVSWSAAISSRWTRVENMSTSTKQHSLFIRTTERKDLTKIWECAKLIFHVEWLGVSNRFTFWCLSLTNFLGWYLVQLHFYWLIKMVDFLLLLKDILPFLRLLVQGLPIQLFFLPIRQIVGHFFHQPASERCHTPLFTSQPRSFDLAQTVCQENCCHRK